MNAWWDMLMAGQRMWMSAGEVIWRRSMLMATGALTPTEATRMVTEKASAFATGTMAAGSAVMRNRPAAEIVAAGMRPVARAAAANTGRLRRAEKRRKR